MKRLKIFAAAMAAVLALSAVPMVSAKAAGEHKLAAITFDDGPGSYTEELLDGLRERGVHATFFVVGTSAQRYPEIVKRISQEGHQLGNHSYSHANLNKLSVSAALKEMTGTDGVLYGITGGGSPYFYRVPYGNSTGALREQFKSPAIFWSVDTLDWKYRDAAQVEKNIKKDIKDGSIVLVHDIHKTTVKGVLNAIDDLQKDGYEFVTVRELYRRRGVEMKAGGSYYSCPDNGVDLGPVEAPKITTKGVPGGIEVTIEAGEGVPIYYSTDGSPIGFDAKEYTGPFTVEAPCTVRAVAAIAINGSRSEEISASLTKPQAQEPAASFTGGRLTIEPAAAGDTAYYSINGGEYTRADGPISLKNGDSIKFYAQGEDTTPSKAVSLFLSDGGNLMADVDRDDWYYGAIDWAAGKGYIEHTEGFKYGPNETVTRGELAGLIYRAQGEPWTDGSEPFEDVDNTTDNARAIAWCYSSGIFQGYGDGRFGPSDSLQRQELAKAVCLWLETRGVKMSRNTKVKGYLDRDEIAQWAAEWVDRLTALGVLEGSDGRFDPTGSLTLAQAVTAVRRAMELRPSTAWEAFRPVMATYRRIK